MTTSLGDKLKRHRQEKGYSLDKLAELTESSKSYLWELENRDTRKPSAEKLTRGDQEKITEMIESWGAKKTK